MAIMDATVKDFAQGPPHAPDKEIVTTMVPVLVTKASLGLIAVNPMLKIIVKVKLFQVIRAF